MKVDVADLELAALYYAELGHLEADSNGATAFFVFDHRVTRRKVLCLDAGRAIPHSIDEIDIDFNFETNLERGNNKAFAFREEPGDSKMTTESLVKSCFDSFSSLYEKLLAQVGVHLSCYLTPNKLLQTNPAKSKSNQE